MRWKMVNALAAVMHAKTRDAVRHEEEMESETVYFSDGTALRVKAQGGTVYSEQTQDPIMVTVHIGWP